MSLAERCALRAELVSASVPWGDNCSLAGILAGDLSEEKVAVVRTYSGRVMDISLASHKEENGVGARLVMGLAVSLAEVT